MTRGGTALKQVGRLAGDRIEFDQPWVDLLALPVALLVALLFGSSWFGRLLMVPVQIQFHELGHAMMAWLSSRPALPLPFGFTFIGETQSLFTGACVLFLLGLFLHRSLREKRPFAALLALLLLVAFGVLSLLMSADASRMLFLLGGIAGEFVLSALVLVSFYVPLPDRMRWDFFRFVVLGPAMACWVAAIELWFGVWRGTANLPMGSIVGGEGAGDLDRLIAEYGFDRRSLTALYGELALWTMGLVLLVYGVFALRAALRLRPRRRFARRAALSLRR